MRKTVLAVAGAASILAITAAAASNLAVTGADNVAYGDNATTECGITGINVSPIVDANPAVIPGDPATYTGFSIWASGDTAACTGYTAYVKVNYTNQNPTDSLTPAYYMKIDADTISESAAAPSELGTFGSSTVWDDQGYATLSTVPNVDDGGSGSETWVKIGSTQSLITKATVDQLADSDF